MALCLMVSNIIDRGEDCCSGSFLLFFCCHSIFLVAIFFRFAAEYLIYVAC